LADTVRFAQIAPAHVTDRQHSEIRGHRFKNLAREIRRVKISVELSDCSFFELAPQSRPDFGK